MRVRGCARRRRRGRRRADRGARPARAHVGRARPARRFLVSVLLRPELPAERTHLVTLAAGLAAIDAVARSRATRGLKWPNDVVVDDRKLAGILAEADGAGAVVVGMGCNVRPGALAPELRDIATAVRRRSPGIAGGVVVPPYDARLAALDAVVADAIARSATLGRRVRVELARDLRGHRDRAHRRRVPRRRRPGRECGRRRAPAPRRGLVLGIEVARDEVAERGREPLAHRPADLAHRRPSTWAIGCTSRVVDDRNASSARRARRSTSRSSAAIPTLLAQLEHQRARHAEKATRTLAGA